MPLEFTNEGALALRGTNFPTHHPPRLAHILCMILPMPELPDDATFASRYRDMSDGELLKLAAKPWEVSDEAWDALEDELDRRGLDVPEAEAAPVVSVPEKRNLVLLRRFRDMPEALLAKGKLESSGLEVFLADDNMVRLDWFYSNLVGGVKLMVDAEQFAEASRVLNEPVPEGWLSESEE